MSFVSELEDLINKHSIENESNTPNFILAGFIRDCLNAYNTTVIYRDAWFDESADEWVINE